MKMNNMAVKRPVNTRAKGVRPSFNVKANDPKFKDRTAFKRPRTVIKYQDQVLLTSQGMKNAVVALVRVKVAGNVYAEYYMARSYHMEYDEDAFGDVRVYDSKRMPCVKKGKILWEVTKTKHYMINGEEVIEGEEKEEEIDFDLDNSINPIDDFDSTY